MSNVPRFPALHRLLVPAMVFAALNAPVHPASAAAPVKEAALDVSIGRAATIPLPLRTNLVAVSVPSSARLPELEVQDPDGAWHEIHFDADHAPDPIEGVADSRRRFSAPVWLGSVDELRLRGDGARRARLHLINSLGDDGRGSSPASWLGSVWRALTVPRSAEALVPDQPIISRAEWGADESWVRGRPAPASTVHVIFVHHTDGSNSYRRSDVPAIVRGIYRYHTKTQGWSDIGYNFLVDRFGRMYEGRGGGIETAVVGAHARNANTGSSGIALIGNFTSRTPGKAMRRALARLVAWKADVHHMPVVGKTKLSGTTYKRVSGHRDANPTACPGSKAYGLLPWVRRAALKYGTPKIYLPRTSSFALRRDGDGNREEWRILSWGSGALDWTLRVTDRAGLPVHEQTHTGVRLETDDRSGLFWRGVNAAGARVPSGRYRWALEATDSSARSARGASGYVVVINDHLPGTVLTDSKGTYLLSKNPVGLEAEPLSPLAAKTRFRNRTPVPTGPGERGRYASAPAGGLRLGALLSENGTLLVVTGSSQVSNVSSAVAATLGYDAAAAIRVKTTELSGIARGAPITDTTRHPPGTYVSATVGGELKLFRVREAGRVPVTHIGVLGRGVAEEVVPATAGDLALPVLGSTEDAPDGTIVRVASGTRWYLADGKRRKVADNGLFGAYGYTAAMSIVANHRDISHLPIGDRIE